MAPGGVADVGKDAPDLLVVGAAAGVEAHTAMTALEQCGAEMALQHTDAVGDRGRGDAELLGGRDEKTLVPGRGFEESQAVERREGIHGIGDVWPHEVTPSGREARGPVPRGLQDISYAPEPVAKLFLPRLHEWLDGDADVVDDACDLAGDAERLQKVIGAMLKNGGEDTRARVLSVALCVPLSGLV